MSGSIWLHLMNIGRNMSVAQELFEIAIKDVEELIETYDLLNREHKDRDPEVLKRAALIMALTAWETYVEDRFSQLVSNHLVGLKGSPVDSYIQGQVERDLRHFHTPNSRKVKMLFDGFIGKDITESWVWESFDATRSRETLNMYIRLRGDVVHRAVTDKQQAHAVKKDDVQKCVRFLKALVNVTDDALEDLR